MAYSRSATSTDRPDAARKRFPLLENGLDIRQNEIRQPHSD
jgi:hypothetical protein